MANIWTAGFEKLIDLSLNEDSIPHMRTPALVGPGIYRNETASEFFTVIDVHVL